MLISFSLCRFARQLSVALRQRHRTGRLRTRRHAAPFPLAACVDVLETREMLSSIVVSSLSGGQNYATNVTANQLDPAQTAVTLRDAINAANNTTGADTILFDAGVFPSGTATPTTIVLAGGTPLQLTDTSGATTIAGPGPGQVAVSGNSLSTVFLINIGVTAEIDGLTITGGKGSIDIGGGLKAGGGIYNNGRLTLQNAVLTANAAGNYGGGFYNAVNGTVTVAGSTIAGNSGQLGGGFFNGGVTTVTNTSITGNAVTSNGGGIYNQATVTLTGSLLANNTATVNGGGVFSNNTATLVNTTLTGNSAGSLGGGYFNSRTAIFVDSTIAGNFASQGGGVYNLLGTSTLSGTIVARNAVSAANSAPRDWAGLAAGAGSSYNLVGDGTATGLTNGTNHNLVGTSTNPLNPRLAPLGDYGGPTQTMALLPGSAALAAGSSFTNPATGIVISTDERGVSRSPGSAPDIGAYQSAGFAFVLTSGNNQSAIIGQSFADPLTVQLTEKAFGRALRSAGVVVSFTAPPTSSSATLSTGSVATNANGTASITAQANGTIGGPYAVVASSAGIDAATFELTNLEVPSLVVTTTQDVVNNIDGLTSLREAIAYAGTFTTATTITFDASVFPAGSLTTITLGGTALHLTNTAATLTISGPGAGQVAISGNGLSTVFVVDAPVSAAIEGLAITGGNGALGGGIQNAGTLSLRNDWLSGNAAGSGGAVYNTGSLTVTGSTFSGDSAGSGGAFYNAGNASFVGSTITGNFASTGAGLYSASGASTLTNVTIAGNFAQSGGGVFNSIGDVTLLNTILAWNSVSQSDSTPSDWAGSAANAASGFNLIGDGSNSGLSAGVNGNLVGDSANPIDPHLGSLADNGGPTLTMAVLAGSPAINAGSNALLGGLVTDQRGAGFSRIAGGIVDIGAFEIQSHPPAAPTVTSLTTTDPAPILTGTWDALNAFVLQVTISNAGLAYSATYTFGVDSQLTASNGGWALNLAGTPPLAVGSYNVVVHTANEIGEGADSDVGSLTIASTPPIVGALNTPTANVGTPVTVSAVILGGDTTGLEALIDWGDGTTSAGTIATVNGVLTVSGTHAYSSSGDFDIELTVTNDSNLSASVGTSASIVSISTGADLQVTGDKNVQIVATSMTASYEFDVTFVSGGVKLIGTHGTTFNGASTLFLANARSVSAQLGDGDDHVRITGKGQNVTLALGGGHNDVICKNFEGDKLQVSSDGGLRMHAWNSTLSNLIVTGGSADGDHFHAIGLRVTGDTLLALGGGLNVVKINDCRFKTFKLHSSGWGTIVRIEAGRGDGIGTQFDGTAQFELGGGARLTFSPLAKSDRTVFNGKLIITAESPDAAWRLRNVRFAQRPTLVNVDVV